MKRMSVFLMFGAVCLGACFGPLSESHQSLEHDQGIFAPLYVGMADSDVELLGFPTRRASVSYEDEAYEELIVSTPKGDVQLSLLDTSVRRISTKSFQFQTSRGVSVGSTISELRENYPRGQLMSGMGDGGYLTFALQGERAVFVFPADDLSNDCLSNRAGCPEDFDERRSIVLFEY